MDMFLSKTTFDGMKTAQYEDISIVKDMECPNCHESDINGWAKVCAKPVGWCDTRTGYMAIFECPKCFTKYRCHINTTGRCNQEAFYADFALMFFLYKDRKI